jgi:ATP-dependent protease ClpP protease subunit
MRAKELDAKLSSGKITHDHTTPLYLYINSPGGSVQSGLEMIEALKGLGRPVHTITAFGASMAWQTVQNLDERYVLKSGILMSHRAAGQFSGSFGGTAPSQLDSRVRLWTQITKEMDEATVARTNGKQTMESYQKAYSPELWVTGQEAVNQGYADAVVKVKCGKDLTGTTKHETEFMGIPISYELDACPLNSSPMNIHFGFIVGVSQDYVNRVKEQFLSGYQMKMSTPQPMAF